MLMLLMRLMIRLAPPYAFPSLSPVRYPHQYFRSGCAPQRRRRRRRSNADMELRWLLP